MENFIDGYDKIIMYYGNNERAWLKFNSNKILNKYNTMFFLCWYVCFKKMQLKFSHGKKLAIIINV